MAFGYGHVAHRRQRGKHFKLFSDELPRIDFDKTVFEEYGNVGHEHGKTRSTRRPHSELNTNQLLFPPLGSLEWEKLSEDNDVRPKSNHSSKSNSLNPDFSQIQHKIRRRNTYKETTDTGKKKDFSLRLSFRDRFISHNSKPPPKKDVWCPPTTCKPQDNETIDVTDKTKGGSVFQELLGVPEKKSTRLDQISHGLSLDGSRKCHAPFLNKIKLRKQGIGNDTEHGTSDVSDEKEIEVISESRQISKPGILKRGVRVRETNKNSQDGGEAFLKPKLVHQEDLPIFGSETRKPIDTSTENEVRITLYVSPPLNRLNDVPFVPLSSRKPHPSPKRVNFQADVIKEVTEQSDGDIDAKSDKTNDAKEGGSYAKRETACCKIQIEGDSCSEKEREKHTNVYQNESEVNKSREREYNKIGRNVRRNSRVEEQSNQFSSRKMNARKQYYTRKGIKARVETEVTSEDNTHDTMSKSSAKRSSRNKISRILTSKSSGSSSRTTEIDSLSELSSFYDDDDGFSFDNLPDEIDRSLTGEELIKAYRIWNRKRKALAKGLRRISAPVSHENISNKHYGEIYI